MGTGPISIVRPGSPLKSRQVRPLGIMSNCGQGQRSQHKRHHWNRPQAGRCPASHTYAGPAGLPLVLLFPLVTMLPHSTWSWMSAARKRVSPHSAGSLHLVLHAPPTHKYSPVCRDQGRQKGLINLSSIHFRNVNFLH